MNKTIKIHKIIRGVKIAIFVILIITFGFLLYYRISKVDAAERTWMQTDWRGGESSEVITGNITTFLSQEHVDFSNEGVISISLRESWGLADWGYRRVISFDNTLSNIGVQPEVLVDFPILIKLENGVNIDYSKTNNNGSDIRFLDSDGTPLSYEIEEWDESGISYLWVKVPQIDIGSNDYIYLYYGNTQAVDEQNSSNVWDDGFLGVWHLNDNVSNLGEITDSTGVNHGVWQDSDSSGSTGLNSLIGKGIRFGLNDKVATPITTQLQDFTVEIWFKDNSVLTSYERLADKSYTGCFWVGRNNAIANSWGGGVRKATDPYGSFVSLQDGQWNQIASVRNGTNHFIYGNGSSQMATGTVPSTLCTAGPFGIGAYGDTSTQQRFGGDIDEVRLSSISRSRAWIAGSYKSGTNDFLVYDSEDSKFFESAQLVSNVFDTGYPSDFGTGEYTVSGLGDVEIKVRTDINPDMNTASDWETCDSIVSGSDISNNNCVNDEDRYIQYMVVMNSSVSSSSVLEEIEITFSASDQVSPGVNASNVYIGNSVSNDDWINFEPTLLWGAGQDNVGGNGVEGYCISLDEVAITSSSSQLNPAITSGILSGLDDGVSNSACPYIVIGLSIDLSQIEGLNLLSNKEYYFSIKAVDFAGNIYSGDPEYYKDLVWFKYDNTKPSNVMYISTPSTDFGSVDDMFFNWPRVGGSVAIDNESGLLGWQYAINSSNTLSWKGTELHGKLGIEYIPFLSGDDSLYFSEEENGEDIIVGNNTIYFRSIDNAGNFSTYVTGGINFGGAAPEFPAESVVTITPEESESNLFSLSWPEATPVDGDEIESYYFMINTQPPSSLSTLKANSNVYIPTTGLGVQTAKLIGAVKGTNNVYVVAVDNKDNYSPTKAIHGTFELDSSLPNAPLNVSVADLSIKANELWRVAVTWEEPEYKGNGDLTYIIKRSANGLTWSEVSRTPGLSYTDIVPNSQTYFYKVSSIDSSQESVLNPTDSVPVSIFPKGRYEQPAELISEPVVNMITTRFARVAWVTDRTSDSKVQIGLGNNQYFQDEMYRSDMLTNHEIELTNLQPGTTYYYRVKWTDSDGNTGISKESVFQTKPAPVVEDVIVDSVGLNFAILKLTTSGSTKAEILYGKTKNYGGSKEINTSSVKSEYSIMLTELEDGTEYHYKIVLTDEEGYEYESFEDHMFSTPPRPRVSNIQIQEKKEVASPTVEVYWDSNIAVNSIVRYTNEGKTLDKVDMELKQGEHMMEVTELKANSEYQLIVEGVDAMGNRAMSDIYSFTTATDTRPPQISSIKSEGDIQSSEIQSDRSRSGQLIVSWDTDEPSTSQVMYGEGASGDSYPFSTQTDGEYRYKHVMIVSNLSPSKVYHFKVVSKDGAGNSGESGSVTAITPKSTDSVVESILGSLGRIFGFL